MQVNSGTSNDSHRSRAPVLRAQWLLLTPSPHTRMPWPSSTKTFEMVESPTCLLVQRTSRWFSFVPPELPIPALRPVPAANGDLGEGFVFRGGPALPNRPLVQTRHRRLLSQARASHLCLNRAWSSLAGDFALAPATIALEVCSDASLTGADISHIKILAIPQGAHRMKGESHP
jgi:hypothetical protein